MLPTSFRIWNAVISVEITAWSKKALQCLSRVADNVVQAATDVLEVSKKL